MKFWLDTGNPKDVHDLQHLVLGVTCNPILLAGNSPDALIDACSQYRLPLSIHHDSRGGIVKVPFLSPAGTELLTVPENANVTGLITLDSIRKAIALKPKIISVFFGRAYDVLGAERFREYCEDVFAIPRYGVELLWASVRSCGDIVSARHYRADIITVPPAIMRKYINLPRTLESMEAQTARDLA